MSTTTEEELIYLNRHLQPISHKNPYFLLANSLNFAADPYWPETQNLKDKYEAIHQKLISVFKRDDWLEILLALLGKDRYNALAMI